MKPLLFTLSLFVAGCSCCSTITLEEKQTDSTTVTYNLVDIPIPATDKHFELFPMPFFNGKWIGDSVKNDSLFTFQDEDTRGTVDLRNKTVSIHTDEKKVTTPVPEVRHEVKTDSVRQIQATWWEKYGTVTIIGAIVALAFMAYLIIKR